MVRPLPYVSLDEVFHVGLLDAETRTDRASLEAFLLSVSVDPEDWASIARCGGPTWTLDRPGARYIDAAALDDETEAGILSWGIGRGYAKPATIWRVWIYDDEGDNWGYMSFPDEAQARAEADEMDYEGEEIPSTSGEALESVQGHILTSSGMTALERWAEPTLALEGLVLLWAREVLLPKEADLMGVWWSEDYHPEALSCPRGGIFPERLEEFRISDEHGNSPGRLFLGDRPTEITQDPEP